MGKADRRVVDVVHHKAVEEGMAAVAGLAVALPVDRKLGEHSLDGSFVALEVLVGADEEVAAGHARGAHPTVDEAGIDPVVADEHRTVREAAVRRLAVEGRSWAGNCCRRDILLYLQHEVVHLYLDRRYVHRVERAVDIVARIVGNLQLQQTELLAMAPQEAVRRSTP